MIIADSEQSKSDIVLFYPGESLNEQVAAWADTHPKYALEVSFARFPPEIQELLRNAAMVLLDGTEDPYQAAVAFSQAVAQPGGYSVAVYTERMYEWLELFIRIRGALLLLGPMGEAQWEGFFKQQILQSSNSTGFQPVARQHRQDACAPTRSGNGSSAGRRRHKTGVIPR